MRCSQVRGPNNKPLSPEVIAAGFMKTREMKAAEVSRMKAAAASRTKAVAEANKTNVVEANRTKAAVAMKMKANDMKVARVAVENARKRKHTRTND